ncbi:MAG: DUF4147 domain-containing protein [Arhodomonas sp.]|nr:DUF4147 domain-containing protein [Arhodomonas sp.]
MEDLGPGGDADALAELNRRLLADGLAIDAVDRVRKRVSRIKAGRLGRRLRGAAPVS